MSSTDLTSYFEIDDQETSRFLRFMTENGFSELAAAINEVNRAWFSEWENDRGKVLLNIKGLTMLPESLMKSIYLR